MWSLWWQLSHNHTLLLGINVPPIHLGIMWCCSIFSWLPQKKQVALVL